MLKLILACLLVYGTAHASDLKTLIPPNKNVPQCVALKDQDKNAIERSGCCSHHGGVCGCSGTRQRCCDGALSPSCLCNKEENNAAN